MAGSGCDDFGYVCSIFAAFFGLFFGVEPPGQCTGTGPCIISSRDCGLHRHVVVDIHIEHQGTRQKQLQQPTHNHTQPHTTTHKHNNLRSHFGSSRGHSWPGSSQWLPRHLPLVWFEATRAALHVWPVVGADGHVRTACMEDVGSAR